MLVTRHGLLGNRRVALMVKLADEGIRGLPAHKVRRWGRRLLVVDLVLPDGSRAELAARESARIAMVGPFLAAALTLFHKRPPVWGTFAVRVAESVAGELAAANTRHKPISRPPGRLICILWRFGEPSRRRCS